MKTAKPIPFHKMGKSSPIVNDAHFSDAHAVSTSSAPPTPGIGSPMDSFNPGGASEILPSGPPKYIQPAGKRPMAKGLTNKRVTGNL